MPSQSLSVWDLLAQPLVSSTSMVLFHSDRSSFNASLSERSSLSVQFKEASRSLSITSFYFSLGIMLPSLFVSGILLFSSFCFKCYLSH